MFRFAFILDQQVGLRTQALNFERVVGDDPSVEATWVPVRYAARGGPLARLPGLPSEFKGTLRGIREIRDGLGNARRFQAALWATWAAKSVPDLVAAAPAFVVMDMTPVQMEAMGERYGYTRARARFMGGWKRRATQRLYRQATHLFPWNDWVAASLRDDYGVPAEKVTPISPGVDVELYRSDPAAKPGDGVVRLLFVGGDFERKGGDLLLRWARETRIMIPWELHIATRDEVPDTPRVVVHRNLPNNSPELIRLYQQSDVFVLPTRADCYSLVAMEAMAAGLPTVISRLGGIPDIVQEGQTGYLIDSDDYAALAAHLDRLTADPGLRQTLGNAAHRRACAHFNCRINLQRVLDAMKAASGVPSLAKAGAR
jgi:glycosyltransferase involved in cell wall biosynthesis